MVGLLSGDADRESFVVCVDREVAPVEGIGSGGGSEVLADHQPDLTSRHVESPFSLRPPEGTPVRLSRGNDLGSGSIGLRWPGSRGATVRFATVNLFARFVDADDFAAVLKAADPDLLLVVELHPKAASIIADRYPHHHLVPDRGYSGWGFAARYPMQVEAAKGWDRGGAATVVTEDAKLHVAGVHILDPMHRPWRKTVAVRERQVDSLLAWGDSLPADEPQLVAGDFNATPIWSVYRRLAERWPDLVASGSPGTRPLRTWGIPAGPRVLRIDHVLGSGVVATGNEALRVKGSDHSMVVVDLKFA